MKGAKTKQEVTKGESLSAHNVDSVKMIANPNTFDESSLKGRAFSNPDFVAEDVDPLAKLEEEQSYRAILLALEKFRTRPQVGQFNPEVLRAVLNDSSDEELAEEIQRSEVRARVLKMNLRQQLGLVGEDHKKKMTALAQIIQTGQCDEEETEEETESEKEESKPKSIAEQLVDAGLIKAALVKGKFIFVLTQSGKEAYYGVNEQDLSTLLPVVIERNKKKSKKVG